MAAFCQTTYSNEFSWMKHNNLDWNFIELCSYESNWQYPSIGSDNGMAPTRSQAISLTNDG